MAEINQTFKKGQEYIFSISEIPEINTDNVRIVQCTDYGYMLDCRIINDTTIGLTYNQSGVDDFTSMINLRINGVSGYDDYDEQTYDGTQNILEFQFQINGEVQKIPFILVNNGESPVTIIMQKNNTYNYADDKIWHCEGLEEGTYSNDVTVDDNFIIIGTIPAHQKMFMKTTLDSLSDYKIQDSSSTATIYPINIQFYNGTDFTNITFEGDIMALVNYNFYGSNNRLKPNFHALFKDITTLKVTPSLSNIVNLYGSSQTDGIFSEMFSGCYKLTTITDWPTQPNGGYAYSCYRMFHNCSALVDASMITLKDCYSSYCYKEMFKGCTSLTKTPKLLGGRYSLPYSYQSMFENCSSLTTAPSLPTGATLYESCYQQMFSGCTSLTTAPELPATTLATKCYYQMFYNCTSLTTAPELPATTLASSCYGLMFGYCSSLTNSPVLPATTLAKECYSNMFSGCTSLIKAPALPVTNLYESCYFRMFANCSSLTTAPNLPATRLARNCYDSMFSGCTKLNYVKALFLDTPANNNSSSDSTATDGWLEKVSTTGTFVKNHNATWDIRGNGAIPYDWTVITDLEEDGME